MSRLLWTRALQKTRLRSDGKRQRQWSTNTKHYDSLKCLLKGLKITARVLYVALDCVRSAVAA